MSDDKFPAPAGPSMPGPLAPVPGGVLPYAQPDGSSRTLAVADRPASETKCTGCVHMFGMLLEGSTLNLREDGTPHLTNESWCTAPKKDEMISLEGRVVFACSRFSPTTDTDPAAPGRAEYLAVLKQRQRERDE